MYVTGNIDLAVQIGPIPMILFLGLVRFESANGIFPKSI